MNIPVISKLKGKAYNQDKPKTTTNKAIQGLLSLLRSHHFINNMLTTSITCRLNYCGNKAKIGADILGIMFLTNEQ
jgi:hypothetical protein